MATQVDVASPELSAEMVGRAFVTRFYHMLHHTPDQVYRFYNDQSTMIRPGPTGSPVTVTTMEGIKDLILSLDCTNNKAELLSADTQASYKEGITVLVTGYLTGQDNVKRTFIESFFLAPQETGFFVLNDTFKFVGDVNFPVTDSVEEHCDTIAPAAPIAVMSAAVPVEETTEVSDNFPGDHSFEVKEIIGTTTTPAVVKEIVETTTSPVVQQKSISMEQVAHQPSNDSSRNVQPPIETLTNGDVDAPKKSYASLLMNGKPGFGAFPKHMAAKPVKRNITPKSVPSTGQTQVVTVPAVAAPTAAAGAVSPDSATGIVAPAASANGTNGTNGKATGNGHASSNGHVAAKGHSIYIGDLPYEATPSSVEQEFKKFGRIKKNGIQVRSSKGYVFGFVEYEEASAQQKALEMGTVQIGDREIQIEEKKTAARADDYSRRGGYRNDGYRRGNYSNGRGYTRNDYGKRNGEGAPRGRGNGDGFVNQNGGGRGAFQGGAPK